MLEVVRRRDDSAFRAAYVLAQEREADERRAAGIRKNKKGKARRAPLSR